jgi:tetratricopeptide (TPR) repeat protein
VAHWLMEHSGERAGAYAGLIGEHFERGGQRDEAARWYVRAGQHARETYAVETAIPHYQTALGLLPATATAELIACHEGLGELQLAAARMGEAEASYLRMAELAEAAGDLLAAARAWHGIAYVQDNNLNYHGSRESALRAVAFAERADRPGALALSLWHLARAEVRHDNPQAVLELGQRALEALARADDRTTAARWSGMLGIAYDLLGDVRRAVAFQQEALAHYRAVGNRSETATQLNNLGYTCNFHGDFASALGYLEEARAECQAIGSRMVEIFVLSNLGIALNGLGDYAAAEETLRRGIELSESGRLPIFCDIYRALSETYLRQGRVTEAVEAAHQALDVARANEGPREVGTAWRALGEAIGAMSDSQGAPRCFEESMRLFTERNVAAELGRTLRAWARYELQSGDRAAGAELWQRARSTFAAHGLRHELERTPELASV